MLHCDRKEFDALLEALGEACFRCRGPGGLLVQPNRAIRLDAVASAMLTAVMGSTVECEGTQHFSEFQIPRRE